MWLSYPEPGQGGAVTATEQDSLPDPSSELCRSRTHLPESVLPAVDSAGPLARCGGACLSPCSPPPPPQVAERSPGLCRQPAWEESILEGLSRNVEALQNPDCLQAMGLSEWDGGSFLPVLRVCASMCVCVWWAGKGGGGGRGGHSGWKENQRVIFCLGQQGLCVGGSPSPSS